MIRLMEERDGGDQVAVIGGVGGIRPNVGDLDIQWQRKFVHSGGCRRRQHSGRLLNELDCVNCII